jgi:hypothetical protein
MSSLKNPDFRSTRDRGIGDPGWTEPIPGSAFVRRVKRLPDGGIEYRLEYDPWFSAGEHEQTRKRSLRQKPLPLKPAASELKQLPTALPAPTAPLSPSQMEDPRLIENRGTVSPPPTQSGAGRSPSVSEMYQDYARLPENDFLRKYRQISIVDYDRLGRQIAYDEALTRALRRSPADLRPAIPAPKVEVPTEQRSRRLAELKKWDMAATDPIAAFVIATIDSVSKIVGTDNDPELVAAMAAGTSLLVHGAGMFGPGAARPRREATSQRSSKPRSAVGNRATDNQLSGPPALPEAFPGPEKVQRKFVAPSKPGASVAREPSGQSRSGSLIEGGGERLRLMHGTTAKDWRSLGGLGEGRINVTRTGGSDQDLGRGFYLTTDELTAVEYAQVRNFKRNPGGGPIAHVVVFDIPTSELGVVVDIRPGGNFRAQWEAFLKQPVIPGTQEPVLATRRAYISAVAKERGVMFDLFLRSIGMENADTIIAPLGDDVFGGITPGYETTQVCIRSQRIADQLNAMMRGTR